MTSVKTLEMNVLAVIYCEFEIFGQSVNNRRTNAVKTACYLISSASAELTACMENSINNGSRRNALFRVDACGYASSVINYPDNIPGKDINYYLGTIACKCFVDSVVNYLVNKVMQTLWSCGTDIHTGSYTDRFKTFQYLYLIFVVVVAFVDLRDRLGIYDLDFIDIIVIQNSIPPT